MVKDGLRMAMVALSFCPSCLNLSSASITDMPPPHPVYPILGIKAGASFTLNQALCSLSHCPPPHPPALLQLLLKIRFVNVILTEDALCLPEARLGTLEGSSWAGGCSSREEADRMSWGRGKKRTKHTPICLRPDTRQNLQWS